MGNRHFSNNPLWGWHEIFVCRICISGKLETVGEKRVGKKKREEQDVRIMYGMVWVMAWSPGMWKDDPGCPASVSAKMTPERAEVPRNGVW